MNSSSPAENSWLLPTGIVDEESPDEDYYHTMLDMMQLKDKVTEDVDLVPEDISKLIMYFIRWNCGQSNIKTALKRFGEAKTQLELLLKCLNDVKQKIQHVSWRSEMSRKIQSYMYKAFYSLSVPLFLSVFQGWESLVNPSHALELLSSYKALFKGDKSDRNYCHLLIDVLVPAFRSFGNNAWQSKDPDPMIKLIGVGDKLLPSSVLHRILEEAAVLPKLLEVVYASWKPHLDPDPTIKLIGAWDKLLPPSFLETVLERAVLPKLLNVVYAWEPHLDPDPTIKLIGAWDKLLPPSFLETVLERAVLPKLLNVVYAWEPHLDPDPTIKLIGAWDKLLPPLHLETVLERAVLPKLLNVVYAWEPHLDPDPTIKLIGAWYKLLPPSLLNIILEEAVLPKLRKVVYASWEPHLHTDPMIKLIGAWDKLLPPSVLNTILEEAVLPKLMKVVYASWEPHLDTVPVDVWLRPWLPIMGDKLKNLHLVMSYKLCLTIFKTWSPNDDSVFAILSPWKSTFDLENWEKLMQNSVIPMLQSVLKEFQVTSRDVAAQKYDEFHWVTKWISLMPIHLMIDMLKEHFFPKWLSFLYDWLCSGPDSAQVEWFKGWRDVLPMELRAYDDIRAQLSNALCMMNQVAEGNKVGLHRVYLDICRNERLSFSRNQ